MFPGRSSYPWCCPVFHFNQIQVPSVPAKDIKHNQLLRLVYQRDIQFNRGALSNQIIPQSEIKMLRDNKNHLAAEERSRASQMERFFVFCR